MADLPVEVDGGITAGAAPLMAGARVLTARSEFYRRDPQTGWRKIIVAHRRPVQTR